PGGPGLPAVRAGAAGVHGRAGQALPPGAVAGAPPRRGGARGRDRPLPAVGPRGDRRGPLPDGAEPSDDGHPARARAAARGAGVHRLPQLPRARAVGPGAPRPGPPGGGPGGAAPRRATRRSRLGPAPGGAMSYAALAGLFLLAPLLALVLAALLRRPDRGWWATTAVTVLALVALTSGVDSLMIAVDLFRFAEEDLLGIRIGLAPVEDLAWPVAAGVLLPSLWLLLTPKEEG